MKTDTLILAANDSQDALLANAADGGRPFAILQHDGFLVPFGEFPHKQGLQIFDRAAAEEIVATHNSALNRLAKFFGGGSYPIYVGHPDLPGSKDTDKRAYGWIENMRVTDEGLHLSAKWSDTGRELVENAHFKFYSPLWWTRKVKGGIRPVALKSMGLTNDPNIPVPALANEYESQTEEPMDKELLAALGLEEGATVEDAMVAITALKEAAQKPAESEEEKPAESEEEKPAETEEEKPAESEVAKPAESEEEKPAENERVTDLEARLGVAVANAVDQAVATGRLTPAEADAKRTELLAANDLAAALQELGKLPPKVKTSSATGNLGGAKSRLVVAANDEAKAQREERTQLVANEFAATNPALPEGERKRIAWERARRKNPDLFTQKKSTGTAA